MHSTNNLDPTLPNILCASKLLEISCRHDIEILDQAQYPSHLLRRFSRQGVEKVLNRTFALVSSVEDHGLAHIGMLTPVLTLVKSLSSFNPPRITRERNGISPWHLNVGEFPSRWMRREAEPGGRSGTAARHIFKCPYYSPPESRKTSNHGLYGNSLRLGYCYHVNKTN